MKLTDIKIRKFKPEKKQYKKFDRNGLYILVKPNGKKFWYKKYTFNGKEQSISYGEYPIVSLAEAREKLDETLKLLSDGINPSIDRKTRKLKNNKENSNTLVFVAQEWFVTIKQPNITANHAEQIWQRLNSYIFYGVGNIPIGQIDAPLIIGTIKRSGKSDKQETVRRVIQSLNEIMNYACNTGIIKYNSISGVKSAFLTPKSKNMPTIEPKELPKLMSMLYKTGNITPTTRYLALFQLHTMVRPSEAVRTKWEEINFNEKKWVIPAERMKKRKEHVIPLTDQVLKLLREVKELATSDSDYIFPSIRGNKTPHINVETVNTALKRNGFKGILVAHGFRSIASTYLNEHGYNWDWIEECLAHVPADKTRSAYNKAKYFEQRKTLMNSWSNYIEECTKTAL